MRSPSVTVRAVLSCLAMMLLLATCMAPVCAASCAAGTGCHGMAAMMPGMGASQAMHAMHGQAMGHAMHEVLPDCAGTSCKQPIRTVLVPVSVPDVQVLVDAVWVRLPVEIDASLPMAYGAARDVSRGEQMVPPQLRSPLRV